MRISHVNSKLSHRTHEIGCCTSYIISWRNIMNRTEKRSSRKKLVWIMFQYIDNRLYSYLHNITLFFLAITALSYYNELLCILLHLLFLQIDIFFFWMILHFFNTIEHFFQIGFNALLKTIIWYLEYPFF